MEEFEFNGVKYRIYWNSELLEGINRPSKARWVGNRENARQTARLDLKRLGLGGFWTVEPPDSSASFTRRWPVVFREVDNGSCLLLLASECESLVNHLGEIAP